MIAYLAMLGVGIVSAFLPITPVEPYLIGVVATTSAAPVALGIAAGIGQALGKVVMFLAARGAIRSSFLRRKLARQTQTDAKPTRRRERMARWVDKLSQPRYTLPVLSASTVVGFPPLLAVTVYLARTPMSPVLFGVVCLLGRSLRFVTLALAPHLITG